jgi:hypothetical protein
MKNASTALRAAYFTLLQGLVIDSKDVLVYDTLAPKHATAPYVIMGPQQTLRDNTKDTFGSEEYIQLSVVTTHLADKFSRVLAEKVADEILKRAMPTPSTLGIQQPTDFNVYMAVLEPTNETVLDADGKTVYQKIVTIRHLVEQKTT